ncbi:MAG: HEAT repeat domain-containing protein [Melioribacteraceae bacterium]|nr:HEAT repeat domain-containing protein [Melioribacteraceae bacterium]
MKKSSIVIFTILCWFFFPSFLSLQTTKNNLVNFSAIQDLIIDHDNRAELKLPLKEIAKRILAFGNLQITNKFNNNAEYDLKIDLTASSIAADYNPFGKLYSGAKLTGLLVLKRGESIIIESHFTGRIEPPEFINSIVGEKAPYKNPVNAPFLDALNNSTYLIKLLELVDKISGKNSIFNALKDKDRFVREAAVNTIIINEYELPFSTIQKLLKDEAPEIRTLSLKLLSNRKDPGIVSTLLNLLENAYFFDLPAVINLAAQHRNDSKIIDAVLKHCKTSNEAINNSVTSFFSKTDSPKAVDALLVLASDSNPTIKSNAVKFLVEKNDPRIVDFMINSLNDQTICTEAVEYLGKSNDKRAVEPLIKVLSGHDSNNMRRLAAISLGMLNDPRALVPLLNSFKRLEKVPSVESQAKATFLDLLYSLNKVASYEDAKRLSILFYDKNKEVLDAYKKFLYSIEDTLSIQYFIDALKDSDVTVCHSAAASLRYIKSDLPINALISALQNDKRWEVRYRTIETLALRKVVSAIPLIIPALKDTLSNIREIAVFSLGHIGDRRAVSPLIEKLNDTSGNVRYYTIAALDKLQDSAAVDPIINLLSNEKSLNVKTKAAESLGRFGKQSAVKPLLNILNSDKDIKLLQITIASLGNLKSEEAVPVLTELLISNKDVRDKCVEALININSPKAIELLIPALKSNFIDIRCAAANVFAGLKDPRTIEPLIKALKNDNKPKSVDAIQMALEKITGAKKSGYDNWQKWWEQNETKYKQ